MVYDKFTENRRFIFSMATVFLMCVFWWAMKYDASTLKDIVAVVSIAFLASDTAATFSQNKTGN